MEYQLIDKFISDNIFYTEKWSELEQLGSTEGSRVKQVVVNNAIHVLLRELSHHFREEADLPDDVIAEQCLFILEKDDSVRRAEMGVSYFMASGLYLSFDKNADNFTISPSILRRFPRRKVGTYHLPKRDTFRRY